MFNENLINCMKKSRENGSHAINANSEDIKELKRMVKEGYITNYEITNGMGEFNSEEQEVIFFPTEKFDNL
ncbi:hypothetical protein [Staphylococcus simiae]|uniref:Uncharacterized protein n=1 Tax=Staphylococcus simiae CCM 7213 = CCUG 51256 TaxID=911238 RepID=G5JHA7_9STAP|nr:hypothetical protein [Staphylococcus simiae]EHJ08455.1 hypothetical protein SS7213T_04180 [Staphylococcus simiae CCM 7213 = CCUG 51256]PNZ12558.1 hypothetical protein CD113_06600 [Staphylococcus simiae]SNV67580.1 Uncharacterised protein [Staphylococcus simiae]